MNNNTIPPGVAKISKISHLKVLSRDFPAQAPFPIFTAASGTLNVHYMMLYSSVCISPLNTKGGALLSRQLWKPAGCRQSEE